MTNELTRAWELLTPEQRPVGMRFVSEDDCDGGYDHWVENEPQDPAFVQQVSNAAARDRLCQAVEGVNLRVHALELMHGRDGKHHWGSYYDRGYTDGTWQDAAEPDPDRLTAANNALEVYRSKA